MMVKRGNRWKYVLNTPCACGCGEIIEESHHKETRYVKGHQARGKNVVHSRETIKKISESKKGTQCGKNNPSWNGGDFVLCPICSEEFWLQPAHKKHGVKCCSKKCSNIYKSSSYGNFGSSERRHFGVAWWRKLRESIIERDKQCVNCGSETSLCVHHITPYRESKDNSPSNLVTLCKKCHIKIDRRSHVNC